VDVLTEKLTLILRLTRSSLSAQTAMGNCRRDLGIAADGRAGDPRVPELGFPFWDSHDQITAHSISREG
jgi:hypothetical protein